MTRNKANWKSASRKKLKYVLNEILVCGELWIFWLDSLLSESVNHD